MCKAFGAQFTWVNHDSSCRVLFLVLTKKKLWLFACIYFVRKLELLAGPVSSDNSEAPRSTFTFPYWVVSADLLRIYAPYIKESQPFRKSAGNP